MSDYNINQEKSNTSKPVNENEEHFPLYTEKIVAKPSVKYRKLIRFGELCVAAVAFGAIASVVMSVLYPFLSNKLNQSGTTKQELVITKDEYPSEDTDEESETQSTEKETEADTEEDASLNYKTMTSMLQAKTETIQKSILALDISSTPVGDFITETKSVTETVGLVVADGNNEFTILTDYNTVVGNDTVVVKMDNSVDVSAQVIGADASTGLGVIVIKQSDIPNNIRSTIVKADLDNSYKVKQGDTVIAGGKLYGTPKSVDFGVVTSISSETTVDNVYSILNTGISYTEGDFGFLYNVDGNVIGISTSQSQGTFAAIGISNIKDVIEALINSHQIPYAGIRGQNVTSTLAVTYGLPMGIYVVDVVMDSPVYQAGLQPGDVITQIDGNMVLTIQTFSEKLYQYQNGQNITITAKRKGKDGYIELEFTVTIAFK